MAWLAVVISHKVNGVSELHSNLMVQSLFADFAKIFPMRFCNVTNGVTPRRWLALANKPLSEVLDANIGRNWRTDLSQLSELEQHADFPTVNKAVRDAKLLNKKRLSDVAKVINNDPQIGDKLKVVFIPNYSVSLAQLIIPAADLSEQISTAGTEASGTSNMKFALNGALTIGTLDGANVEMLEHVGEENIFIFGNTTEEVEALRAKGYSPRDYYEQDEELRQVLTQIATGVFNPDEPGRYRDLVDSLINFGDHYQVLADYRSYVDCQDKVDELYRRPEEWTTKAMHNIANMGYFSSDRTIKEYAETIWHIDPVRL